MPPKGMKRPASAAAGGAKKRPRDPTAAQCKEVASYVEEAGHLSDASKAALVAAIPHCLGEPVETRHAFQTKVIDMVGETLEKCKATLVAELTELEAKVAGAGAKKEGLDAAKVDAEAKKTAKATECEEKKATVTKSQEAVVETKKTLKEKEKASGTLEKELLKHEAHKAKYEEAIAGPYTALLEGTWEDVKEVKGILKKLGFAVKELELDESLMTSVASAVEKKPDDRGAFDTVAITNLGDALKQKVAELSATIEGGAAARSEASAAVDAAKATAAKAEEEKNAASEASLAAEDELKTLVTALKEASSAVDSFETEQGETVEERDEKKAEIEEFETGVLATFAALKVKKLPPPEVEEEAPAAETTSAAPPAPPA